MPGYKPHLRFIAINPLPLHDGGSGLRLNDGPGLNFHWLVGAQCLSQLYTCCRVAVSVLYLFLAVPCVDLWSLIVAFPWIKKSAIILAICWFYRKP